MKKRTTLLSLMLGALLLAGCSAKPADTASEKTSAAASAQADTVITLSGSTASCDSASVSIDGGVVTITGGGDYELTGTLDDGMVIVSAGDDDDVNLILNGASITSSTSAAIYIADGGDVTVTLAAGSENTLANGGAFEAIDERNIDAVIFSTEDLTLNGTGSLTVDSPAGHGVVSKDDLTVESGTYAVTASGHGMTGKNTVLLEDGDFTIEAGTDGIHVDNDEDAALGNLTISGGSYTVTAGGDGVSASGTLTVEGGTFDVTAGGGSASVTYSNGAFGWQGQTANTDDASAKGFKSGGDLTVSGGELTVDSADDALHSNANLTVSGGTLTLSSGDDGVHADGDTAISAGTVTIPASYEGIEGQTITISGGAITVTASDDGLNAAGGNDQSGSGGFFGGDPFQSDDSASILISGGTLYVDASGDGIDSNGSITMTGGQVFVSGPTNSGNGALDYGSTAEITGGTIIAAGASGMAENFTSAENQGVMLVSTGSQQAGSTIQLSDASGNALLTWQADKAYECVIISSPDVQQGSTYTVSAGSSTQTVSMTSAVYGAGMGMGGMGQMGGQMQGGMPGGMGGHGGMPGRP